jgi:hypothetical protein
VRQDFVVICLSDRSLARYVRCAAATRTGCFLPKFNQCLVSAADRTVGDSMQIDIYSFDSMPMRRGSGARRRQFIADIARWTPVSGGLAQESQDTSAQADRVTDTAYSEQQRWR